MKITFEQTQKAGKSLALARKKIKFETIELPISKIVDFYLEPGYQYLDLKQKQWSKIKQERYIETLLLGYPAAPLYLARKNVADLHERRLIIDGAQRIHALANFMTNKWALDSNLTKLNAFAGFYFKDLPFMEKERFADQSLRIIMLITPTAETCKDLYQRLNMI